MNVLFWSPSPVSDDQVYLFPTYNNDSVPPSAGPILVPLLSREHQVTYLDNTLDVNCTAELVEQIQRHDVLCVSIPQFTSYPAVRQIIRQIGGQVPTVAGGPFATHNARWLCEDGIDFVVRGEGEETLPELLRRLESREPVGNVLGITYRQNGAVLSTADRPYVDMDEIPFPDYDLLPPEMTYTFLGLETSRGCPYDCTFCNILYHRALRSMSPERVLEGIRHVERHVQERTRSGLYLLDSNLTYNSRRLAHLADSLGDYVEQPLKIGCSTSLQFCTPARNKQMARAGFVWVNAGLEVGYADGHRAIHKAVPDDVYRIIRNLEENGIMCLATFILGLPHETPTEVMQTVRYIQALYKAFSNVICLVFSYRAETARSYEEFQGFSTMEKVAHGVVLPTFSQEIRERIFLAALLLYNSKVGFDRVGKQDEILDYFAEVEPLLANLFSAKELTVPAWFAEEAVGDSVQGYYHYLRRYSKAIRFAT